MRLEALLLTFQLVARLTSAVPAPDPAPASIPRPAPRDGAPDPGDGALAPDGRSLAAADGHLDSRHVPLDRRDGAAGADDAADDDHDGDPDGGADDGGDDADNDSDVESDDGAGDEPGDDPAGETGLDLDDILGDDDDELGPEPREEPLAAPYLRLMPVRYFKARAGYKWNPSLDNFYQFYIQLEPWADWTYCFTYAGKSSVVSFAPVKNATCSDPNLHFGIERKKEMKHPISQMTMPMRLKLWWDSPRWGRVTGDYEIDHRDVGSSSLLYTRNVHEGYIGPENFTMRSQTWSRVPEDWWRGLKPDEIGGRIE